MKLFQSIAMPAWVAGFKVVTSKCECCQRSLILGQVSAQKVGIRMHGSWYCSPSCFASAVEMKLSELMMSRPEQANHVSRMPLGLILVGRGLLTSAQLREAVDEQKEAGGQLGEILVRHDWVNERQVTAACAGQWDCPVFSVSRHAIQTQIQIPRTLIHLHSVIPLHYVTATKRLLVGFVYGVEYGLLYAIEQMSGCKTQACFVTPSDFHIQMQRGQLALEQCGETNPKEVTFEGAQSPAEMAHILCGYGVDLGAGEAIICRYKDHVWMRLKCSNKEVDILFRTS